ncbi:hypothetical protein C7W93_15405 [Glaciimonas sp. PCH181]|nr:hypothetical protein C7W93_15405 [Glaciimonas sp. PCH181]
MWICRKCKTEWDFALLTPEVDEVGSYFICPTCDHRNELIGVRDEGGSSSLCSRILIGPLHDCGASKSIVNALSIPLRVWVMLGFPQNMGESDVA